MSVLWDVVLNLSLLCSLFIFDFILFFLTIRNNILKFLLFKTVNNAQWGDTVDALCDFLSDVTAYGLFSRPVQTANVAAILHFEPLPSQSTYSPHYTYV